MAIGAARSRCAGETVVPSVSIHLADPGRKAFDRRSAIRNVLCRPELEMPFERTVVVKHAPRDPCELVGESRSQDIVVEALGCSSQPSFKAKLRPAARFCQHGSSSNNEQRAQIVVAALAEPPRHRSVPRRHLFGTSPSHAAKSRPL